MASWSTGELLDWLYASVFALESSVCSTCMKAAAEGSGLWGPAEGSRSLS